MSNSSVFFEISNDFFCVFDSRLNFKVVNNTFTKELNYTSDELIESSFISFLHPDDIATTRQEYEDVKSGKRNQPIENRLKTKNQDYLWLSWSSIVYDGSGLFYAVGHNITKSKKMQFEFEQEREHHQATIVNAIIKAQDAEREQIGRELHDNINQIITTAKLNVEYSKDWCEPAKHLLDKTAVLLQQVINEIRIISNRLTVKTLEFDNLIDSVKQLVDSHIYIKQFKINFTSKGLKNVQIPNDVNHAVYRILQEHFTNIIKYSKASIVDMKVQYADRVLLLLINDNGIGFDPSNLKKGNGMINMSARAENLGGDLVINSSKGNGCSLQATIPITNAKITKEF